MTARPSSERGAGRRLFVELLKALVIAGLTFTAIRQGWLNTGLPISMPTSAAAPAVERTEVVTFDPFVVNIGTPGATAAYLRTTLAVTTRQPAAAESLRSDDAVRARVRSALLEELSAQTIPGVVTSEGRAALVKRLQERAGTVLPDAAVEVLITDFVAEY